MLRTLVKACGWCCCLLLALHPGYSHASCTSNTVVTEIALPATLALSRDNGWSNGTVLWQSGWVGNDAATVDHCDTSSDLRRLGYADSMVRSSLASTYATSLAGIGIQVAWVDSSSASPTFGARPSAVLAWPAVTQKISRAGPFSVPARYAVRLVKTGPITPGELSFAAPLAVSDYGDARAIALHLTGRSKVSLRTCTTPDVTVDLGSHPATALVNTGDTTPAVAFAVRLQDCPPGMAGISYQFTSWEAQAEDGVVAAQAQQSTAVGVGVFLTWRDGTPLQLMQTYSAMYDGSGEPVSSVAEGGSFSVPLRAALYRMPALALVGGDVVAEVEFRIWYQ